jgi:hypothetical protein
MHDGMHWRKTDDKTHSFGLAIQKERLMARTKMWNGRSFHDERWEMFRLHYGCGDGARSPPRWRLSAYCTKRKLSGRRFNHLRYSFRDFPFSGLIFQHSAPDSTGAVSPCSKRPVRFFLHEWKTSHRQRVCFARARCNSILKWEPGCVWVGYGYL